MPCLSRYSCSDLNASTSVSKALSQLAVALEVDDRALRQRHFLAESVARLQRRGRRLGRRRRGGICAPASASAGGAAAAARQRTVERQEAGEQRRRRRRSARHRRILRRSRRPGDSPLVSTSMATGQSPLIRHINRAKAGQEPGRDSIQMGALANQPFVKMNGIGNEIVVVDLRGARRRSRRRRRARPRRRRARPTIS